MRVLKGHLFFCKKVLVSELVSISIFLLKFYKIEVDFNCNFCFAERELFDLGNNKRKSRILTFVAM